MEIPLAVVLESGFGPGCSRKGSVHEGTDVALDHDRPDCLTARGGAGAEPSGIAATSPDEDLPSQTMRLTVSGERADSSHKGPACPVPPTRFSAFDEARDLDRFPGTGA